MDPILQVVLILAAAKIAGEIVERAGSPALIGEIAAGIVLGPSLFGLVAYDGTMAVLADIGIIALLFISGIQMNLRSFVASERPAASTAILGIVVPFLMGAAAGVAAGFSPLETLFTGVALSVTSIGVSVRALADLRKMNTPSGATIVGAAVIDDIVGILLLAVLTAVAAGSGSSALSTIVGGGVFLAAVLIFGRRLLPAVLRRARAAHTHEMPYTAAIALALSMAYLSHLAGLHYAVGAFLAGLLLGDQIRDDRTLFEGIADFSFGFFVTFFFASIGLLAMITLETLLSPFVLLLVPVAFAGKILGGWLGSVRFMETHAEALVVGIGLCPRGEITLVIGQIGLLAGLITDELFSAFTVVAVVSVLATPALMAWGYRRPAIRGVRRSAGAR